jgi:hypothetical protein
MVRADFSEARTISSDVRGPLRNAERHARHALSIVRFAREPCSGSGDGEGQTQARPLAEKGCGGWKDGGSKSWGLASAPSTGPPLLSLKLTVDLRLAFEEPAEPTVARHARARDALRAVRLALVGARLVRKVASST